MLFGQKNLHRVAFVDQVDGVGLVFAVEGEVAAEQLIGDNSDGPHIDGLVVAATLKQLRRLIVQSAGHGGHFDFVGAGLFSHAFLELGGCVKIDQLER